MTIYAAGAILWREEKGKLLVAVIHRSRHKDWSFPKGKVDPGETFPQAAVREIYEETGLKIKLGVKLPTAEYKVPSGENKEVHYWAAKVSDKSLSESKFKPSEEVAKVDWLTPEKAHALLTYKFDNSVLKALEELHKKTLLKTFPVIVLRHAKATSRSDWHKGKKEVDDGKRPLLADGKKQAKELIPLLNAFGPKRVITSPWARCFTSVQPYAKKFNLPIIERSQLSELGNKKGPRRTRNVVKDVIAEKKAAVVCSHRPALPTILESLSALAGKDLARWIEEAETLKPAEMIVIQISVEKLKVVTAERWTTEPVLTSK
jgi:8-oxo-dGTP diphosphatase